jgi:cytidylate kinase
LVDQQRALAEKESVIMDGRDIGTYVLPNADLKVFQVADLRKRAERRYIENIEKGISCNLEDVIKDLENRDFIDSNRAFAPLSAASDAIVLDTSDMTIFEVVTSIGKLMEEKLGLKENE